ncbi:MAG: hypothetical protein KGJ86_13135 [Chloroflexota bacterium]|nr:hypothetical protein [Chloroflexota bacterium]
MFRWNMQGVLKTLQEAEVMTLILPLFAKALMIDLRHNEREGPFIAVDGMVGSARERMRSLERLRPYFPKPTNVMIAPWWGFVRSLESSGALPELRERLRRLGFPQACDQLQQAYRDLLKQERTEIMALVRGDPEKTRTLWQK